MRGAFVAVVVVLGLVVAAACGGDDGEGEVTAPGGLTVSSDVFTDGGAIPREYTCDGAQISPPIQWSGAPQGTRAFVLTMEDPDTPRGTFDHWVVYDFPVEAPQLTSNAAKGTLPGGARQGRNDAGNDGYAGPCPPKGSEHRYVFKVFALDAPLGLEAGKKKADVAQAMDGHILAGGQLTGRYKRE